MTSFSLTQKDVFEAIIGEIRANAKKLARGYDQNAALWFASMDEHSYNKALQHFRESIDRLHDTNPEYREAVRVLATLSIEVSPRARIITFGNIDYCDKNLTKGQRDEGLVKMQAAAITILQKLPQHLPLAA
jgi:hypothetical protein